MRIVLLHAPLFRAHWRREHEVLACGPHADCDRPLPLGPIRLGDLLADLPWTPDLLVVADDGQPLTILGLETAPCPVALVAVATHQHEHWQAPLGAACDAVFVAQRDSLATFAAAGAPHATWLPCWAPDVLPAPTLVRALDATFIGTLDAATHPSRAAFLHAVAERVPLVVGGGERLAGYAASRVVLNHTESQALNLRVFEAMACGAALVTERAANGLGELFTDGTHCLTYPPGGVASAVAAVRGLLADDRRRARLAEAGRTAVLAAHCARHRAATVLDGARTAAPVAERSTALARAWCQLAESVRPGAATVPALRALEQAYLDEAERLACTPAVGEPDRSGILGAVALARGEIVAAVERLEWAAHNGGAPVDHVACIEALIRAGELSRAVRTADALWFRHPDVDVPAPLRAAMLALAQATGTGPGGA